MRAPENFLDEHGHTVPFHSDKPPAAAGAASLCLRVSEWLARDLPPPDFLMGEWLSTTSRAMLVATTGLGKTNFAMAVAAAMAAGASFLQWRARRPARVLFVDGEMSRRLLKARLADTVRRLGSVPENLFVLSRDDIAEMAPLNSRKGQAFVEETINQIGGIDFIFFDNVMSLINGDMKEEESWQDTLPWVMSLTRRSIGQLWVHHTGHDETRSYGTKTREWHLDTVLVLERLERSGADIAFTLTFTKCRERAPHNREDFASASVVLAGDRWDVEGVPLGSRGKPPSPKAQQFHEALLDALASVGSVRSVSANRASVTMAEWKSECARRGILDAASADRRTQNSQSALFSKYRTDLIGAKWVACNGDFAWSLRQSTGRLA